MFCQYADHGEPERDQAGTNLEKLCLDFIREDCQGLNYSDSQVTGKNGVPFNYEQDINRLCFERAIHRFMETGTKEDAFDIYYCYCDMFAPFGRGYKATRILLETLSEHEGNSSSLLMSHRDHYSHSVYVFLLGIAVYKGNKKIRQAFNKRFGFMEEGASACGCFLKQWGLTALFHDIGYPFEIAHQQIKNFAYHLVGQEIGKKDTPGQCPPPYVSYGNMNVFTKVIEAERYLDLNDIYARELEKRFGRNLGIGYSQFYHTMEHRAVDSILYMDHAYFSGLLLLKRLLSVKDENGNYVSYDFSSKEPLREMDSLIAILLHNSLFRFEFGVIGSYKSGDLSKRMSLADNQPLAYLLMLCDELQCWDRTAYGQNTRRQMSPYGADIHFGENGKICMTYQFDSQFEEKCKASGSYKNMNHSPKGTVKFRDDIGEFLCLEDMGDLEIQTMLEKKTRILKKYVSSSDYLNLYDFALALNGRYNQKVNFDTIDSLSDSELSALQKELEEDFSKLTLEYRLSNLAQAKNYQVSLEKVNCFYSSSAMDYEMVTDFTEEELAKLSILEHERWANEKLSMGWTYGNDYKDKSERERRRVHKDLVEFDALTNADQLKDAEPMRLLIKLLDLYDGLRLYRMAR